MRFESRLRKLEQLEQERDNALLPLYVILDELDCGEYAEYEDCGDEYPIKAYATRAESPDAWDD